MCAVVHADSVEDAKNRALTSAATDVATTAVALANGARDYNPLIGSNSAALIPITVLKIYLIDSIAKSDIPVQDKKAQLNFITSLWGGASINNFLVLLGATGPVCIMAGIVGGLVIHNTLSEDTNK
jgi:hypothetical protein